MEMKKVLFFILWILLARIPLSEWEKIPDQKEFLRLLGQVYLDQVECKKVMVGVMKIGDEAVFFADCVPEEVML
jgi:hypothetical protein